MRPISTKELNYVRDALSWELLASKCCHDLAQKTPEQEYRRLFDDAGTTHQRNYERLLDYVDSVHKGKGAGQS